MDNEDTLLIFVGVNLIVAVFAMELPLARRHLVAVLRAAVAIAAGVWTVLMAIAFLYFQVTEPPAFLPHPGIVTSGFPLPSDAALQWDMLLSMTVALAWWTTVATLVMLLTLWLTSAFRGRRWEGATS